MPLIIMFPSDGCRRAPATDRNVLFPEPEDPITATNSPGFTDIDTLLSAVSVLSPSL